jgi:NAD(P)-dependent dehydrogenase (short-subunit alcohol dehydrogenase family)
VFDGKIVIVTGSARGLGRDYALRFAGDGASVVVADLLAEAADSVVVDITAAGGTAVAVPVDVTDVASTQALAAAVLAQFGRIDILVDNAGSIYAERATSPDGFEASMALMAIGPFALVAGLLPLLEQAPGARVIAVTSGGMYAQALDVADLDGKTIAYTGARFYARAKRAQVALIREWARRTAGSSISFNAMHPGWARTPGLSASLPGFDRLMGPILRTPEEGIDTIIWLATAPRMSLEPGRLYLDRRPRPFDRVPSTRLRAADRVALWDEVVRRTGGVDPAPD